MTTLKRWFKLMWANHYIQLAILFVGGLILCIVKRDGFYEEWGFWVSVGLLSAGLFAIVYLGFYRFWKNLNDKPKE